MAVTNGDCADHKPHYRQQQQDHRPHRRESLLLMETSQLGIHDDGDTSWCHHGNDPSNHISSTSSIGAHEMETDRHTWGKKIEYFLSVIGFCVGLGNVWRFPYVCMRNGGGAFLIPFFLALFLGALPVFLLEVTLGQFSGRGPWHAWNFCPLLRGIGISMNIFCLLVAWYYSIILAWCLIYLVNSFYSPLPWTLCGQAWNTDHCLAPRGLMSSHNHTALTQQPATSTSGTALSLGTTTAPVLPANGTAALTLASVMSSSGGGEGFDWWSATRPAANVTDFQGTTTEMAENESWVLSTDEFWLRNVLEMNASFEDLGGIPWHTALALIVSNAFILIAIIKGIHSSSKVVYVTATLPYFLLGVILIMGCTLPGAGDGLLFFIRPDFSKLLEIQTWVEAAIQVFYSLGPGWGCLVTMTSYNKFHNNCVRDSVLLTIICEGTSVFGGFAIFTFLGHMAHVLEVPISDFAKSGPGLTFIVYPEAISYLPLPQLWGVLFFLMLFMVGLDTQFANFETLMTTITDVWPAFMKRWSTLTTALVVCALTCLGLVFTSRGGIYTFQLVDWYIAAFTLLSQCALECVAVAWLYGADRFCYDMELMVGKKPPAFFVVAWKYFCPLLLLVLFIGTLVFYQPPTFAGYQFPPYAQAIGWMIAILPFLSIVMYAIVVVCKQQGSLLQRVKLACQCPQDWGPAKSDIFYKYNVHYHHHHHHRSRVQATAPDMGSP